MILKLLYLFLYLNSVIMYEHQKLLAEKMWSEKCKRNSVVLNDCNWCWCDHNLRYQCKARVCEEVDMFGHFKDAIREIDVGMEGRGSWRSTQSSCTPGVHYRRGSVLCICDEDGNWPNPVCRDLFRVLHSVETTGQLKLSNNDSCEPMKLYLVGCNVCFCPSSSILDPALCTNRECEEDDPVVEAQNASALLTVGTLSHKSENNADTKNLDIYATCNFNSTYKLGCRECRCLTNNRLLCNTCLVDQQEDSLIQKSKWSQRALPKANKKSYCYRKTPGKIFYIGCNSCHCDKILNMYCTTRNCIPGQHLNLKSQLKVSRKLTLEEVEEPPDIQSCIPGTQFKKQCNICKCLKVKNGFKVIQCTLVGCSKTENAIDMQKMDCVKDTFYELDCMICYCSSKHKTKHQMCYINTECLKDEQRMVPNQKTLKKRVKDNLKSIDSLHGYCEPLHRYKKDCNSCRCLSDGKTLMCTSMLCNVKRSTDSLTLELVPVYMKVKESCPKGNSFKLDCNLCFCLSNGNAICTTADCSKEKYI